ncbi:MAG: DNA polymerase I [Anaerolineaceae bacterium]|nr:DNA polymerase I [Anaerolineaceae bacterium]
MPKKRPLFVIIDGHALAYRQFFALTGKTFTTSAGEPTNAIYGFARTLLDILEKVRPDYLALSFDRGLSGRDDLYGEYKGTREKMEDDLRRQLDPIEEMVTAFNIPILALEGYEADDVIGTVAQQAEALAVDTHIVTGDRDLLQLLTPYVVVQLPKRGEADVVYDTAMFQEKYGLEPRQLVDLKALMGDSSDNIPGVRGIGEKTATALLQAYETLDGVYEHVAEVKGANQQKLINGRDMAYLSQKLATIQRDVPVELHLEACVAHDFDVQEVDAIFARWEFRGMRDRLVKVHALITDSAEAVDDVPDAPEGAPIKTVIVQDEKTLAALVKRLNAAQGITWDVETTSADPVAAVLVGIALAVDEQTGYYIPVGHGAPSPADGQLSLFAEPALDIHQLPLDTVLDALRDPLTNPNIPKFAHNASYDLVVMRRYGIDVAPIGFDTMIAEWTRDPVSRFLGLKNLARERLGITMTEISSLIGTGKKQITMDAVPLEQAGPYAAADAAVTHQLVGLLRADLEDSGLVELYETLELPFIPVIAAVEQTGVVLDTAHLATMSADLDQQLQAIEQNIYEMSGVPGFNINSPKQLNEVLFDKLNLSREGIRKTTHGQSTAADVLENLRDEHPVIGEILNYRELTKLKGTYVDALPALINPHTGRVHTSYNQTGTSTGRLSSSNPNLQNIPIRTEIGREVRRAFIAPPGSLLLGVDYSQIELRVLAHYSQDETLRAAFAQNRDIHAATAAAVYGIPLEEVTYEQRSFAKRVNFGLIYGMGAFRLARDSDLTLAQANAFIDTYFARLPGVRRYLDDTKQQAREPEGLTTLFGRRRVFNILRESSNKQTIQSEERVAINMPIQGSAADIMKRAMIDVHHELRRRGLAAKIILQVHDELVLEVPEAEVPAARDLVVEVMEGVRIPTPDGPIALAVPLRANAEIGPNWRDMEDV